MPEPLPNGKIVSAYTYPDFFWTSPETTLDELTVDLLSTDKLSQDQIHRKLDEMLAEYAQKEGNLLAYVVWEEPMFDVTVPEEFCIGPFCIFDWCVGPFCWKPPRAGETLMAVYRYRFWLLSGLMVSASIEPLAIPFFTLIGWAVAFIVSLGTVMFVYGVLTGQVKLKELQGFIMEVLKSPGENVKEAIGGFTGPLMALGAVMVAGGLLVPMISMRVGATVPLPGGARVETDIGTTGRAPEAQPRRRR